MAPKRPDTSKYLERSALTASSFELDLDRSGVLLDVLEHHYKRTHNPLYVWRALQMAHELDIALPEWVLSYLRKSADQLLEISDGLGDKTNAAVAEALNIKTSGRGTYFKRLKEDERNFKIYMLVHDERERTQPRVDTTINEMIGEEFGLTSSAVRKIVEQYSEFLKIKD